LPSFVATNLLGITKSNLFVPSPETFVKSAIKTVEISDESTGYQSHAVQLFITKFVNYLAPALLRKIAYEYFRNAENLQKYLNKN
jgi:hypothetical protein